MNRTVTFHACSITVHDQNRIFVLIKRTLLKRSEKRPSHIPMTETYNLFIDPPENVNLKQGVVNQLPLHVQRKLVLNQVLKYSSTVTCWSNVTTYVLYLK